MTTPVRELGRLSAGAVTVAAAAALAWRLALPRPFLWIWPAAMLVCAVTAMRSRMDWARNVSLLGFALALTFGALEAVFAIAGALDPSASTRVGSATGPDYIVHGGELGYAPKPGARVGARRTAGERVLYDATYSISDKGVRSTPGNPLGDTWLFMGCSMTFGEGVNDGETLPAYFSRALGYRANVVNLSFSGYGPHQMLRLLEMDAARRFVHAPVRQVIYQAIWDHPQRAAGRVDWDLSGPAYAIRDGRLVYTGPLHGQLVAYVLRALGKSEVFHYVLGRTLYRPELSARELELYERIVERSARLARERYGAGFTVLYWDIDDAPGRAVLAVLRKAGLPVVLVSSVIPRDQWSSVLIPIDGHPRPEAYRRLATALAARFHDPTLVGR